MSSGNRRDWNRIPICEYQHRYFEKWADAPMGSFFNTSLVFELTGDLDRAALKQACRLVTQKHDITHAVFTQDGARQHYGCFDVDDFYSEQEWSDPSTVMELLERIVNEPFDLTTGPVCRIRLIRCSEELHYCVFRAHHVIADSSAATIFLPDFIAAYHALRDGGNPPGFEPYSYADCVQALHERNTDEKRAFARRYWESFLEGVPATVAFPRRGDWVAGDHSAESTFFELRGAESRALRAYTSRQRSTLFIVLSGLYGYLLSRYASQEQVLISYPVNMRPPGHGHVMGCFVNLALEKIAVGPDTTLDSLVEELTQQRRESRPHVFYPLSTITREKETDIEASYFTVFFGETHLNTKPLSLAGLRVEALDIPWSREFDRELRLLYDAADPERIRFRMDFQSRKFDREVIARFVKDFEKLCTRALDDPRPLSKLDLTAIARSAG